MAMKFSLWTIDHESVSSVRAYKEKDTNSSKEVEKWQRKSWGNAASLFRPEEELNAEYLQTFTED